MTVMYQKVRHELVPTMIGRTPRLLRFVQRSTLNRRLRTISTTKASTANFQERCSETSWSAFHESGGRNSTKSSKSKDMNYEKSPDKNNRKSSDNEVDRFSDRHSYQVAAKHNWIDHQRVVDHLNDERLRDHELPFRDEGL